LCNLAPAFGSAALPVCSIAFEKIKNQSLRDYDERTDDHEWNLKKRKLSYHTSETYFPCREFSYAYFRNWCECCYWRSCVWRESYAKFIIAVGTRIRIARLFKAIC